MKKLNVPLVHQPEEHQGCGENSLLMLWKYFAGKTSVPWREVDPHHQCHQKEDDADNDALASVAELLFECVARTQATIQSIIDALAHDHPVLINYLIPYHDDPTVTNPFADQFHGERSSSWLGRSHLELDGHYSVIVGFFEQEYETHLIINDPLRGQITIPAADFEKVWRAYYSHHERWMLEVWQLKPKFVNVLSK